MALRITDRLSSPFGGWGGNSPNAGSPRGGRHPSPSNRYAPPTQTAPRIPHIATPPTPPGALSPWDDLFKKHASTAGVDWRLLVAQCRQESGFNPTACSWAGACGLMQLMPQTAASLGVPRDKIFDPETNVAAAARLMAKLSAVQDISQMPRHLQEKMGQAQSDGPMLSITSRCLASRNITTTPLCDTGMSGVARRWVMCVP